MLELFKSAKSDKDLISKSRTEANEKMKSLANYKVYVEAYSESIEKWYFWLLEHLKRSGYDVEKTEDKFLSAEMSGLWGISSQRLAYQQEKVQQLMGALNSMVKQIFQIVRSIRLTKQRLDLYRKAIEKKDGPSDIALKGLYIDMVQGSSKNPTSVYGMATQLGFTTLPDLFFNIHVWDEKEMNKIFDNSHLLKTQNVAVVNVLKRQMILFIEWRDKTYEELKTSERFYLASLRQQYDAIKMYINWVKPYLKVIHRLKNAQFSENSRDIITAFDTSTSDLELFAIKKGGEDKKRLAKIYKENEKTQEVLLNYEIFSVVRIKMHFRSAPVLTSGKEYQRVPTHIGRCEIDFDGYAMSENEIQAYLKDENNEAFDYLKSVNSSLDSLGKELKDYLEEAEKLHSIQTGTKKIEKKPFFDMPNELKNLKQGFSEILTPLISPFKAFSSGSKSAHISRSKLNEYKYRAEKRKKYIEGSIGKDLFVIQKLFRKAHKLLTW